MPVMQRGCYELELFQTVDFHTATRAAIKSYTSQRSPSSRIVSSTAKCARLGSSPDGQRAYHAAGFIYSPSTPVLFTCYDSLHHPVQSVTSDDLGDVCLKIFSYKSTVCF